jgi:hypothetical protein
MVNFQKRRMEILWSVTVEMFVYKAKEFPGNCCSNKYSVLMLHGKYMLPCYSMCAPWTPSTWEQGRSADSDPALDSLGHNLHFDKMPGD